jgi:isopentenyldiphosphate isomerase
VRAYGVHLNGYVRTAAELALWIGTRAMDRAVAPGKFDNMVAGGQPAGLGLRENLVKECAEEAALPAALAARARAAGAISYAFNSSSGLRNDVMFCYDLEMPAEVTPRSADGEVSGFELMPIADVLGLIRDTDRFKLNVNLVILDFAIRHGVLTADNTPDFEAIVTGLRSPLALDSM